MYHPPIDVVLGEHHVVQPDILHIARERLGVVREASILGAPDLIVEIVSPSTAEWDRATKRRIYGRYGVRAYWMADPEGRGIEVAAHNGQELATVQVFSMGMVLASPLLPGLAMEIDEIFRV